MILAAVLLIILSERKGIILVLSSQKGLAGSSVILEQLAQFGVVIETVAVRSVQLIALNLRWMTNVDHR